MIESPLSKSTPLPEPGWYFVPAGIVAGTGAAAERQRAWFAPEELPPFGFTDRSRGRGWFWWDGTRTEHSILEAEDAQSHVRRYLEDLFPTALSIELEERR